MKIIYLAVGLSVIGLFSAAQALNFDRYGDWLMTDQLYYSTFNEGEQWYWRHDFNTPPPEETVSLAQKIQFCHRFKGTWSHIEGDCVLIPGEYILDYIEFVETGGEGYRTSAITRQTDIDPSTIDPATLDWNDYENWSPALQLYFSTNNEGETNGALKPWSFE